jgi:hypothetical protein
MISAGFDYFRENRTDIMIGGNNRNSVAPYVGITAPSANLGKVNAKGYEIELKFNNKTSYGLSYRLQTAVTHTENKIIFADDPQLQSAYLKKEGYSVGQTWTQIAADFYRNWDDIYASIPQSVNDQNKIPGFYDIVDFNGDGYITADDAVPYGYSSVPENTYNLTVGADYKGFSLMLQFYGVSNVTRNVTLENYYKDLDIVYAHARDYWSKDNPNASSFLPRWKTPDSSFIGDYYYYDGSYIRLKTAEVAYSLPHSVLNRLGINSCKILVNGNNLWFWSRMPDDRENNNSGNVSYPTVKRINFGIDVTF